MQTTRIALDVMGGDHGPRVVIPAALLALTKHPALELHLVGEKSEMLERLENLGEKDNPRIHIHHAPEKVEMDDPPAVALRSKKKSSMRLAINLVKEGKADACVSAGNTGALMAIARFVLKTIPGIDRPAIVSPIPTMNGRHVHFLDLGANVDCHADHLVQFAVMGSVLCKAIDNNPSPKVALLNIGAEAIKGSEQVKRAAQLLSEYKDINYTGFAEGNDLFKGTVDVIVCDGFVGNVTLKAIEGLAKMFKQSVRKAYLANLYSKICGLISKPVLKPLIEFYDPGRFNGASLLGLKGIVIKSHGSASVTAFANAIEVAVLETESSVPQKIRAEVESHLAESKTPLCTDVY